MKTLFLLAIVVYLGVQGFKIEDRRASPQGKDLDKNDPFPFKDAIEGDMLVKDHKKGLNGYQKREAFSADFDLWPNATVPYYISYGFYSNESDVILAAIAEFHNKTCVRWVDRTDQTDYVFFTKSDHCGAYVGRIGGCQNIFLKPQFCFRVNLILHEMMHAIAFVHEHGRSDRDQYVTINESNIIPGAEGDFAIHEGEKTILGPYDFASVMHYPFNHYSIDNTSLLTIEPINQSQQYTKSETFSPLDVMKINKLYKCPGHATTK